jgi:hypothetical protein
MENKWKEICYLMKINKASAEDLFQSEVVNIFEKLGWSRYNNEIEEKRKIDIGSAKSLKPDIIIKTKERDLFAVELKKPTVKYTGRNDSQIFSYMRQLKLNVGLLINDRIHVFYEDENCRVPVEIMNIEFNENAQDGLKFLALFSRQTYNHEILLNYCKSQLKSLDAVDYLTSDEFKNRILDFIKEDASEKFTKDVIEIALKSIEITITNTIDLTESEKSGNQFVVETESKIRESDYIENEIEKVKRRIPRWLNNPNQTNSRILIKAMDYLSIKDSMSFSVFEKHCENIDKFRGNFEQMANFGTKNHGKVFERNGDNLALWLPVKDFVKESYLAYKRIK